MADPLLLWSLGLLAVSGLPACLLPRRGALGAALGALLAVLGAAMGVTAVCHVGIAADPGDWTTASALPGGNFSLSLDPLGAVFLLPVLLVSACGQVYGLTYWRPDQQATNHRKLRLCYGLASAAMVLVTVAQTSIAFLVGWEVMALSAYFLVTADEQDSEACAAGWVYLAASRLSALILLALFALLRHESGSYALVPSAGLQLDSTTANVAFLLGLIGFGLKAGLMPLHVWLPGAHANAPSHVSALMSGVLIKMGVLGWLRLAVWFPHPPTWWGTTLLVLGGTSAVLGIVFAAAQHDLKRLLAYSSIENVGIITLGLGLATLGRSLDEPTWVVLGLAGAMLHVWNHAAFKSLLFLSAGSVIHVGGTRQMDQLGGLAKGMPWTARCFLIGAVAVCGLPPLNGFVSEWVLYLGLLRTVHAHSAWASAAAFTAPLLAFVGAVAVLAFVKAYAIVFLGEPRTDAAKHPHDAHGWMRLSLIVLAGCCAALAVGIPWCLPYIERAIPTIALTAPGAAPLPRVESLAPLRETALAAAGLTLLAAVVGYAVRQRISANGVARSVTWDCGYAAPTARMQYTGASLVEMLVGLFSWALRPRERRPSLRALFPQSAAYGSQLPDPVLEDAIWPSAHRAARFLSGVRYLQQGSVHAYLLYIFVALIALLFWR